MYISDKIAKRFLRESFELNAMRHVRFFRSTLLAKVIVFQYTKCQSAILFRSQNDKKKSITKPRQLKKQEKCKRIGSTISESM